MTSLLSVIVFAAMQKSILLIPLVSQGGLGEAWAPLMAEHLAELSLNPLYPPALAVAREARECKTLTCYEDVGAALGAKLAVAGTVSRQGAEYFLSLTLHDSVAQREVRRVERNWLGRDRIDNELRGALRDLIEGKEVVEVKATASDALAMSPHAPAPPAKYRPASVTLLVAGAAALVAGGTMFGLSRAWLGVYAQNVRDYNALPRQPLSTFELLQRQSASIGTLSVASYIAAGVGLAALGAGIGLYVAGSAAAGGPPAVALVPTLGGAQLSGAF